jgi:regulator of cell morphogenesis and NO signaling
MTLNENCTLGEIASDWNTAPLAELIGHILAAHHDYLKRELPALDERLRKVVSVHGEREPEMLPRLLAIFTALRAELEQHLRKEEAILFPAMARYEAAVMAKAGAPFLPFGSFANPIRMMLQEHESAGEALRAMRELTADYALPAHACATYRALFEGLQALETDLHLHIHLENNILFPRAMKLEQGQN